MHARNETCAGGDALQDFAQGVSFDGRKWRCDRVFEGVARLVEVGQQTAGLVGESDRECTAIIGMGCAFDKSGYSSGSCGVVEMQRRLTGIAGLL